MDILGVALSVVFFMVGYRQTLGARRERSQAANREVERILQRLIFVDDRVPSTHDIRRLLEGKALDHRVRLADLYSEEQVINVLFARVLENEIVSADRRADICARLVEPAREALMVLEEEAAMTGLTYAKKAATRDLTGTIALGITATTASMALFQWLPELIPALPNQQVDGLGVTAGISGLVILAVYVVIRLRSGQTAAKGSQLAEYSTFVKIVRSLLGASGFQFTVPTDGGADFILDAHGRSILIEAKSLTPLTDPAIVRDLLLRLDGARMFQRAAEALLVTPGLVHPVDPRTRSGLVRIVSLSELNDYLYSLKRRG